MNIGARRNLVFVSPRFLFPIDSGGKIRTTQVLRGMRGGAFKIRLLSPGTPDLARRHRVELEQVCDEFHPWPMPPNGLRRSLLRSAYLLGRLPMSVRSDFSHAAQRVVREALGDRPDVAVFDFLHTVVLAPPAALCPSVLFTHNVEAEIFDRHRLVARNPFMRAIWAGQHAKMRCFEQDSLRRFDVVVAVSDRDAGRFESEYGIHGVAVIPTGVDLEYFTYTEPDGDRHVVFCGSMDWLANQEAVAFFMDRIWPRIARQAPDARMTVVGRAPPAALVSAAARRNLPWTFTGFVDDVRPVVSRAAVSVIPLRVGGGTRLKVYESMAMGPVVVSTRIGVEGLPVEPGRQCLVEDDPDRFADAVAWLLQETRARISMAREARRFVDENFGYRVAAHAFEQACIRAIGTDASQSRPAQDVTVVRP